MLRYLLPALIGLLPIAAQAWPDRPVTAAMEKAKLRAP